MLTAARLLDDPKLPLRDALQTPEAVADLLARYAVPALIPGRELSGAAVLYFKYAPGRKCVGLYALQLRGEPQQRPRWATVTLAKDDRLEGIHSSSYGGRTDQAVYVPEHRCLVESFPSDWELPTLGLALDPAAVARLAADGRAARADPSPHLLPTVEVLRHRPHDSFVLRYQGVAWADGTREMVGKLYRAGPRAAEVGRKLAMLHPRAAARGFAVPKPLAVVDRLNLLLMERVRGASVKDLIEADDAPSSAERATRAAARALAALHSLPFASDERRSLATELNRLRKRAG